MRLYKLSCCWNWVIISFLAADSSLSLSHIHTVTHTCHDVRRSWKEYGRGSNTVPTLRFRLAGSTISIYLRLNDTGDDCCLRAWYISFEDPSRKLQMFRQLCMTRDIIVLSLWCYFSTLYSITGVHNDYDNDNEDHYHYALLVYKIHSLKCNFCTDIKQCVTLELFDRKIL